MSFPEHTPPLIQKSVQQSAKLMGDSFQDGSCDLQQVVSGINNNLDPLIFNTQSNNPSDTSENKVSSSSYVDHCWEFEEVGGFFSAEGSKEVHKKRHHIISLSRGNIDNEGTISCYKDTKDETDQGFSCDYSQEKNYKRTFYAHDHNIPMELFDSKDHGDYFLNQHEEALVGGQMRHQTYLSVGDPKNLEREGYEDSTTLLSSEHAHEFVDYAPATPQTSSKSSWHGMGIFSSTPEGYSHSYVEPRRKSCEDMDALNAKSNLNHDDGLHVMEDEERDNNIFESEKDRSENPSKEFKIKRIEEWINMIDLEDITPLHDTVESSYSTDKLKKVPCMLSGVTAGKLDAKTSTGMEAAKNYISSLTAISTSAQLAIHGLVVVPVLSAFVNLRVLNLSGNSIVRITAGAFPRGLHMLDLSKNNISTIEGLRELTRLRVLNLSYNRISRIGHGLASCCFLRELYLAGNKISEVEGLHRLLKLTILDLSLNKISTAKCLDQLAANYSSLQTIILEGNPAQRNIGDEQVKKYVQCLLPHLIFFNRQPIKIGSSKEVSDCTARSAFTTSTHNKLIRKGTHRNTASHRQSSSSAIHSRLVSSGKLGKGRRDRIPLTGAKASHHRSHHLDLFNNLAKLRVHLSMH